MRCRVLVLGSTGMLGRALVAHLRREFEVVAAQRHHDGTSAVGDWSRRFDARDLPSVDRLLDAVKPAAVVNCVAKVPGSNAEDVDESFALNAALPHRLDEICRAAGTRLVHFSTDAVFRGDRGDYTEADVPDAADLYGRSKARGELTNGDAITLRTTFVGNSPTGRGLVSWLFRQPPGSTIDAFTGYRFSPVSLPRLCAIVAHLLQGGRNLAGLYHVSGPSITKHDLLAATIARYDLPLHFRPVAEPRRDLTLNSDRFWADVPLRRPSLDDIVDDLAPGGIPE